jgi:hypothetical protein
MTGTSDRVRPSSAWHANNVLAFGARGDGISDDTDAVQAALDTGGVTYFPAADYRIRRLTVPNGAVLRGDSSGGYGPAGRPGKRSRLTLADNVNDHLLYGGSGVAHVRVVGLHLDGNKGANASGDVVHLADTDSPEEAQWRIDDCYIENAGNYGVYVGLRRQAVKLSRCLVYGSASTGAVLHGSDGELQTVIIGRPGLDGIECTGWLTRIVGCDVWGAGRTGINLYGGVHEVAIIGTGVDRNQRHGLYVGDRSDGISVIGCAFHSNSQEAHNAYPHIKQDTTGDGSGTTMVVGCTFDHDDPGVWPNRPSWAIEVAAGLVDARANRLTPNGAVQGYLSTGPAATSSAGWTAVTLTDGWATNPRSSPLQFRIVDERLWLRGVLRTAAGADAGTAVAVLPGGARPAAPLQLNVAGGSGPPFALTRVDISAAGVITVEAAQPAGGVLFFDALCYPLL